MGIDACIIKQATNNNLHPHVDKDKIHQLVKENCIISEVSIENHRLYCVPSKTIEILWDGGGCHDENGYPNLSSDGQLVCITSASIPLISNISPILNTTGSINTSQSTQSTQSAPSTQQTAQQPMTGRPDKKNNR